MLNDKNALYEGHNAHVSQLYYNSNAIHRAVFGTKRFMRLHATNFSDFLIWACRYPYLYILVACQI